jgi:glutamate racemase
VALAEEGLHQGPIADGIARHYLEPLFRAPPDLSVSRAPVAFLDPTLTLDTLVWGCTHFPMLAGAIRAAVGPDIKIVDSAATTAKAVRETLERESLTRLAAPVQSTTRFLATDSVERFARIGSRFLERPIHAEEVELVDL